MTLTIITLALLVLAGIARATQQKIQFHYDISIFTKLPDWMHPVYPGLSWRNKYKNGDPAQGPRFPFSTTLLVWLTDLFHFARSVPLYLTPWRWPVPGVSLPGSDRTAYADHLDDRPRPAAVEVS